MSNYLLLNQAFCQANTGYYNKVSGFGYAITKLGYYVASEQTLYDMPELFENDKYLYGLPIIELDPTDFPQPIITP